MSNAKTKTPRARRTAGQVRRGRVTAVASGLVTVRVGRGATASDIACEVLHPPQGAPAGMNVGDAVIVMLPDGDEPGCVLGRPGPYRRPDDEVVVIEALRELVLKCGSATITLRHDGKLLMRGEDVATVARRRNRIKGGSVDIN